VNPLLDPLLGTDIFSPLTMAFRIGCSLLAAFLIGYERSLHSQPAGLRTHMALSLGACGIMILSMLLPIRFMEVSQNGDPGRMAAQVISGIGFLGAGAIFKFGFNVRGLTTAASVWTMSGIGLVFGAGFYELGLMMTLSLFFILQVVDKLEDWILTKENLRIITVIFISENLGIRNVIKILERYVKVKKVSVTERVGKKEVLLEAHCKIPETQSIREIFESLKQAGKVKTLKIE